MPAPKSPTRSIDEASPSSSTAASPSDAERKVFERGVLTKEAILKSLEDTEFGNSAVVKMVVTITVKIEELAEDVTIH